MIAAVRVAAMMPASRAVWSGSPFLTRRLRIAARAAGLIRTRASATASRSVSGFFDTSTMRTRPSGSTCESVRARLRVVGIGLPSREEERQTLERDGQIHVLQLHARRHLQGARREVQDRPNPRLHRHRDDALRRIGRYGHDGNVDVLFFHELPKLDRVVDAHARAGMAADLVSLDVEERDDGKAFLTESGIVGERQPEVARAENRYAHGPVEPENHPQVALELFDVVPHAANAELTEVGQVFANLRGVQVELFREGC